MGQRRLERSRKAELLLPPRLHRLQLLLLSPAYGLSRASRCCPRRRSGRWLRGLGRSGLDSGRGGKRSRRLSERVRRERKDEVNSFFSLEKNLTNHGQHALADLEELICQDRSAVGVAECGQGSREGGELVLGRHRASFERRFFRLRECERESRGKKTTPSPRIILADFTSFFSSFLVSLARASPLFTPSALTSLCSPWPLQSSPRPPSWLPRTS